VGEAAVNALPDTWFVPSATRLCRSEQRAPLLFFIVDKRLTVWRQADSQLTQ